MNVVDGSLLQRFLSLAGERLRGDWVVIGGCVLPLRGVEQRTTLDIDIAGPDTAGMSDTLLLFGIAVGNPGLRRWRSSFLRRDRGRLGRHRLLGHRDRFLGGRERPG